MKKYIISVIVFFSIVCCYQYGLGRSWDDLHEGEHKIYGKEKEEKYPVKTLFFEKEDWENHYSLMILWFFKYTNYPRYKSLRFLPIYYGLNSKIDNRYNMFIFPLLSYFETDGNRKKSYIICPLYYSSVSNDMSDRSLFFLIWWGKEQYNYTKYSYQTILPIFYHKSETNPERGYSKHFWINPLFVSWKETRNKNKKHLWWAPIIPLTFHNTDIYGGHRNILGVLDYSWHREDRYDSMERFWFFPFVFGKEGMTGILLYCLQFI